MFNSESSSLFRPCDVWVDGEYVAKIDLLRRGGMKDTSVITATVVEAM